MQPPLQNETVILNLENKIELVLQIFSTDLFVSLRQWLSPGYSKAGKTVPPSLCDIDFKKAFC